MADIDVKSHLLEQRYVYYKRLKKDKSIANRILGRNAESRLHAINMNPQSLSAQIARLMSMAEAEAQKESALLNKKFKGNFIVDPTNEQFYYQLTDGLNRALNLQSVYRSVVDKLQNDEIHTNLAAFFPGYMQSVWNSSGKAKAQAELNRLLSNGMDPDQAIYEAINKVYDQVVVTAIKRWLNSPDYKDSTTRSYSELAKAIDNIDNASANNEFIDAIKTNYNLDAVKAKLIEAAQGSKLKNQILSFGARGAHADQAMQAKGTAQFVKGGKTLEYLTHYISQLLANKTDTIEIQSTVSGGHQVKPDTIITIDMDLDPVIDALSDISEVNRQQNVANLTALGSRLLEGEFEDGFIIYDNIKNYTLNDSFKGYAAGSDQTLRNFANTYALNGTDNPLFGKNMDTLIGAIANLIPNALGDDQMDTITSILATDMAYFLFDDFTTIGNNMSLGGSSLHIFNLNGLFVPLSYLLFSLAKAMDEVGSRPNGVMQVYITTPDDIQFPRAPRGGYTMEHWRAQRNTALDHIKIKAKFIHNIGILKDLASNL